MPHPLVVLENNFKEALSRLPRTSPRNHQERKKFIKAVLYDLQQVKCRASTLKDIREDDIHALIRMWKQRGNTTPTLHVKLSRLRVLGCPVPLVQEEGLSKRTQKRLSSISREELDWHRLNSEDLQLYARIQQEFGLKKSEALIFSKHFLVENHLVIPRAMAYNHRDRMIPIITEKQRECYAQAQCLKKMSDSERVILRLRYSHELRQIGVQDPEAFRWQFAAVRYRTLMNLGSTRLAALRVLRAEMGYQENSSLIRRLTCLDVF